MFGTRTNTGKCTWRSQWYSELVTSLDEEDFNTFFNLYITFADCVVLMQLA